MDFPTIQLTMCGCEITSNHVDEMLFGSDRVATSQPERGDMHNCSLIGCQELPLDKPTSRGFTASQVSHDFSWLDACDCTPPDRNCPPISFSWACLLYIFLTHIERNTQRQTQSLIFQAQVRSSTVSKCLFIPPQTTKTVRLTLHSLFESREGTNFTIECGSNEWNVHHFVLALHSDVLSRACNSASEEATTGSLDLTNDGPKHVEALLEYMYSLAYKADTLLLHVEMVVLADKYNIAHLATLAQDKFAKTLKTLFTLENLVSAAVHAGESCKTIASIATTGSAQRMRDDLISAHHQIATDIARAFNTLRSELVEIDDAWAIGCDGCGSGFVIMLGLEAIDEGCPKCVGELSIEPPVG